MNILKMMDAKLLATHRHKQWARQVAAEFMEPLLKMQMGALYKDLPEEAKASMSKAQKERIEKYVR